MKKQLIAVAVCGAFCGLAQAEGGVTVSGIFDGGIMTNSKARNPTATAPNQTGSVTAYQDGPIAPSIYAISGKEDIGGGLKAGFNLEGGFDSGSGFLSSSNGGLFGREAKVTIGGDWGTIGAGLQLDPALVASIATEPRGMTDSFSMLGHWVLATAGNAPTALAGGVFDSNSISYGYSGNGLYVGVLYGFGGVAGSTEANSEMSIGASYTNSGITVSAGYAEGHANIPATATTSAYTGAADKIDFIGAGYAMGAFAARLQWAEYKTAYDAAGTAHSDVKTIGVGGDWKSGANTLNVSFYDSKDNGAGFGALVPNGGKTTQFALLDMYSLSKRTMLYGQIASMKVDQQTTSSGPGLSGASIYTPEGNCGTLGCPLAVQGETSTFINFGIQHTF